MFGGSQSPPCQLPWGIVTVQDQYNNVYPLYVLLLYNMGAVSRTKEYKKQIDTTIASSFRHNNSNAYYDRKLYT